jgi:hypothetical protein
MEKNEYINPVFIQCDCYSHGMTLEVEEELDMIELCMWSIGHNPNNRTSLKERLRW